MITKKYYADPELEVLRFLSGNIMSVSDPDFDEEDYIELPVDPA